jgi:septum formation protein
MRLILASSSPRRADLLRAAGYEFEVDPAEVDEQMRPRETAEQYVARLAQEKATQVAPRHSGAIVIGADTTVVIGAQLLGKPANAEDAIQMLRLLSGKTHRVLTGVALRRDNTRVGGIEVTLVRFLALSADEIAWYVGSGEPLGKAGAYAIQGLASRFIDRIEGSYTNVVGLPVSLVHRLVRHMSLGAAECKSS